MRNDLFDLGADLATPAEGKHDDYKRLRTHADQVGCLELENDIMNAVIRSLNSYIPPGGSKLSRDLYLAPTDCRQAGRLSSNVSAKEDEKITEQALTYAKWL